MPHGDGAPDHRGRGYSRYAGSRDRCGVCLIFGVRPACVVGALDISAPYNHGVPLAGVRVAAFRAQTRLMQLLAIRPSCQPKNFWPGTRKTTAKALVLRTPY